MNQFAHHFAKVVLSAHRARFLKVGLGVFCLLLVGVIAFELGSRIYATNEHGVISTPPRTRVIGEDEAVLDETAKRNLWNGTYLICALANAGHYEFTMNFVISLRLSGYTKFLILCLDTILYQKLAQNGLREHIAMVPRAWMPETNYSVDEVVFGQPAHNLLNRLKTHVYYEMLQKGYAIFVNDVDLVWLSPHILPYIEYTIPPHVEFIYTMDGFEVCGGCWIARPGELPRKLFREMLQKYKEVDWNDQVVLNDIFRKHGMDKSHLTRGLDPLLFANGNTMWMRRMNEKFKLAPWILHANWFVGKTEKQQKLASANAWFFNETGWS